MNAGVDEKRSTQAANSAERRVMTVPNQLTAARLVLSMVLFVLMSLPKPLLLASLVVFVIAAGTDWMDGYYARKYGQVSILGRIFDPFADKIIICGVFICLVPFEDQGSGVAAWMAVVVVGRELLVTALRGHFEQQGIDFSASAAGKWKMVFQCAAAGMSLFYLHFHATAWMPTWAPAAVVGAVWVAIAMTIYSGLGYVVASLRMIRR
ncbi:MAG: CDP-diacylglycerol--glycerol-3-phosphate 3-phosphatidyltransferase [Planctomycetes bacterium]|nr:CDP-diacylglycerol--glycerol-3-phosphate 3-phosphatidyltransferase [Planctomycetota bacterium]